MSNLNDTRKKINAIDKEMAKLFVERMNASKEVAEYKMEHGLPIYDRIREEEVIKKNTELIEEDGKAEIECQFCNKKYNFNKEELEEILKNVKYGFVIDKALPRNITRISRKRAIVSIVSSIAVTSSRK